MMEWEHHRRGRTHNLDETRKHHGPQPLKVKLPFLWSPGGHLPQDVGGYRRLRGVLRPRRQGVSQGP